MPADENAALRDDADRVVRVFPGRVREHGGAVADASNELAIAGAAAPAPSPRATIPHRGARSEEVAARLDGHFESKFREPLSQIATMAAVLRHELDNQLSEQVSAILEAAERADSMFKDLLSFVRSERGATPLARRKVDLKVLCERVIDAIHSVNPDRPVLFKCDARVEGQFDPDAIASLLAKLVSNAMQHGAPRPAIRVELRTSANEVIIDVWNAGPGVDPELTGKLFEPFVCGRSCSSGRPEGLGLGLYLAREIARAHGGRIDVLAGERDGTTFRVTLPRR